MPLHIHFDVGKMVRAAAEALTKISPIAWNPKLKVDANLYNWCPFTMCAPSSVEPNPCQFIGGQEQFSMALWLN